MKPARTSSLWLTTSASAGTSFNVGMRVLLQRIDNFAIVNGRNDVEKSAVRGSARLDGFFGGEFFHFFHQRVDDLRLGHFADHFAALEDQTDAFAKIGR